MAAQNTIFPLIFTLERVRNGYILTTKEETGSPKEAVYRKEVVTEDKIHSRIGQLLHLDTMTNEHPVMFHVEAVSKNAYQPVDDTMKDDMAEAKLAFIHFSSGNIHDGSVICLRFNDTDTIEVYGAEVETAAKKDDYPIAYVGGIPALSFPNTKEGKKSLTALFPRPRLIETTNQQVSEWYKSRKITPHNGEK